MNIIPIGQLQWQAAGNKLEAIEGTITKVFAEYKQSQPGEANPWSFQNAEFRGTDGQSIRLKFKNFAFVTPDWQNVPVRFVASTDPRAKGIVVDEHNGKKSLVVNSSTCEIVWNPADFGQGAPPPQQQQRAQGPPPGAHGPPQQGPPPQQHQQRAQGPPPTQHQAPPQQQPRQPEQPRQPAHVPIHGATVGMAIKIAVDVLEADRQNMPGIVPGTPEWQAELYRLASDVCRVAMRLESGRLAPSAADRQKRDTPPTTPANTKPAATPQDRDHHTEPDYSQAPPPNAAESGQGPRQPAFPSGGHSPGVDDDDIPF